jgi:hypothetical protein
MSLPPSGEKAFDTGKSQTVVSVAWVADQNDENEGEA